MSNIQKQNDKEVCICTYENGTTYIWDLKNGDILSTFFKNKTNPKNSVFFGNTLFSSQSDKPCVHIYTMIKEQPTFTCSISEKVTSILVSPDGNFCFGGTENGLIFIWQICTGNLLKIFSAHLKSVDALSITPDSSILISGGSDTLVNVWNLAKVLDYRTKDQRKVEPVYTISSHSLGITSIQCTIGSHPKIITSSLDRTCKVFLLSSGTEVCSIGFPSAIHYCVLTSSEHILLAGSSNGKIFETNLYPFVPQYVNSNSGTKNFTIDYQNNQIFQGHNDTITCLGLTIDNSTLISSSKDGSCIVWDIKTKQQLLSFKKTSGTVIPAISNLIITKLSKSVFTEKESNFVVHPFKKFQQQTESIIQLKLSTNISNEIEEDSFDNFDFFTKKSLKILDKMKF